MTDTTNPTTGVPPRALRHAHRRYEIALIRANRLAEQRDDLIRRALASGQYTQRQVAAATGLTPGRVGQIATATPHATE